MSPSTSDPRKAARAIARATGGFAFELSGAFGAWRVVGPEHGWHVDLVTLRAGDIGADLAARDFTINAMAVPLPGRRAVDPHGGRADLEARLVRMVSAQALADDPLRSLRAVRLVMRARIRARPRRPREAAAQRAPGIDRVAPERVFGELKRIVTSPAARTGIELMDAHGLTEAVLPELAALRGIEQNGSTTPTSTSTRSRCSTPWRAWADRRSARRPGRRRCSHELLSDELTRGGAMRFAALLHDAAKPQTRGSGRTGG